MARVSTSPQQAATNGCRTYGARLWRRKTLAEFFAQDDDARESASQRIGEGDVDEQKAPEAIAPHKVPNDDDDDDDVKASSGTTKESSLTLFDLLCIGIGGTVGSGVFVLTGDVYPVAGPSASLCWAIGAGVCLLSALSYMELSSLVPTQGSTYAYSYHALGEFAAVAGATSLTLEYGLSGAGVARSWSAKFAALCDATFVEASYRPYAAPGERADLTKNHDNYLDVVAALLQVACALIVAGGVSLSKRVVNSMTVLKVLLVLFLIIAGFSGSRANVLTLSEHEFFPEGAAGVAKGTSLLFFGFIGFDEVCCMAKRSKNPRKALPRAIAGTLFGAALLSTLAQLALSGLVVKPGSDDDDDDHDKATSFEQAFAARGWPWAKYIARVGEVLLLPLVVLLSFMPQPELMAALGEDGIVSRRFADTIALKKKKNDVAKDETTTREQQEEEDRVYLFGCVACGVALTVASLVVPFWVLWNCINLGVLIGFNLSNASLISVRLGNGGAVADSKSATRLALFGCVYAPGAAYTLWKGCLAKAVEDKSFKSVVSDSKGAAFLVVGLVFSFAGLRALRALDRAVTAAEGALSKSKSSSREEEDNRDFTADDNTASSAAGGLVPAATPPGASRAGATPAPLETVLTPGPNNARTALATPAPDAADDDESLRRFRAPGVPWVPGAAIFLNFLLMAQYDWVDHLYLLALYGAAYATYFFGALSDRGRASHSKLDRDDHLSRLESDDHLASSQTGSGRHHLERPLLE